ncbi:hypothetical protein CHUAL_003542 [Chamberlinius hualienensis]
MFVCSIKSQVKLHSHHGFTKWFPSQWCRYIYEYHSQEKGSGEDKGRWEIKHVGKTGGVLMGRASKDGKGNPCI